MSNLTRNQKARRCHDLLLGMSDQEVVNALAQHGFTPEDGEEGWRHLRAVSPVAVPAPAPAETRTERLLALKEYVTRWTQIARAVLDHHHPQVAGPLLVNLGPPERLREETLRLSVFLDRLQEMARGDAPYGSEGPAARALLTRYGFTEEREAEGRALITNAMLKPPKVRPFADERRAATREAEDALWSWYLKWSRIARRTTKDRRLLRAMGFLRRSAKADGEESGEGTEDAAATGARRVRKGTRGRGRRSAVRKGG